MIRITIIATLVVLGASCTSTETDRSGDSAEDTVGSARDLQGFWQGRHN